MKLLKKTCLVVFVCFFALLTFAACTDKEKEEVTVLPAKTVSINNAEDLFSIGQYAGEAYKNYTLKLENDIDLGGKAWTPVGVSLGKAFMGTFDGNGKTIIGLHIDPTDEEGQPIVFKRLLGWNGAGNPVYKSNKIVKMEKTYLSSNDEEDEEDKETYYRVDDIVYEGDNDDPNYIDMEENGTVETSTSFASVGFFGYTKGATIKNVTFKSANLSFFAAGEKVFGGIVSGYDVGSSFDAVSVVDCALKASNVYEEYFDYYPKYATPEQIKAEAVTTQYLGGVVGFAQNGTSASQSGEYRIQYSVFKNVVSENNTVNNCNFTMRYKSGLSIEDKDQNSYIKYTEKQDDSAAFEDVSYPGKTLADRFFVKEAYIGGVAGYIKNVDYRNLTDGMVESGIVMENVRVKSLNSGAKTYVAAQKLNAGGVAACLIGGKVTDVDVENVCFYSKKSDGKCLVFDSGFVGGCFGLTEAAVVNSVSVKDMHTVIGVDVDSVQSVCAGGFAAYVNGDSDISDLTVDTADIWTNYKSNGELAAIMAGSVGVLRDSCVRGENDVKNIVFTVDDGKESDYKYTNCLVAQVYGNSIYEGGTQQDCSIGDSTPYSEVRALVSANNYVNEDGEQSIRLYRMQNDRHSGVYVTVCGLIESVRNDAGGNFMYYLEEEELFIRVNNSDVEVNGNMIKSDGTYYCYNDIAGKWNQIKEGTADSVKTWSADKKYAVSEWFYKVELPSSWYGKTVGADGEYFTYNQSEGRLNDVASTDSFREETTYYIKKDSDKYVQAYELRVSVYAENGDPIVIEKGKTEDDDLLADGIKYSLTKQEYQDRDASVCAAEAFMNKYFVNGAFVPAMDGSVIKDADGRDFSKYEIVTGRPEVKDGFSK